MKLWFASNENVHTAEVVFKIETTKADIKRFEYEQTKALEQQGFINLAIDLLHKNIKFLKSYAEIVSIVEYKKSLYQLAGLYQDKIQCLKNITFYEKQIALSKIKLEKLEIQKKQVKFKVLEFKRK